MKRKWGDHPSDGKGLLRLSERIKRERIGDVPRSYVGQHCRIDCGKTDCQCKFDREHEAAIATGDGVEVNNGPL